MSTVLLSVDFLRDFMDKAFESVGVPAKDRQIVVDVLIRSDLRGIESHGIGRVDMYIDRIRDGIIQPVTDFRIVRESAGTAVIDGQHGLGHVIAYRAMERAIDKARSTGIAAVSVCNSSHFGIAGYYPLMAIEKNMAGLAFTNARPSIPPTFSGEPMMGTNPIAFGVPTDEDCPFLLDMATSIVQRGKIEVYEREGKSAPEGWVIDDKGQPLSDAGDILRLMGKRVASLLPLGGAGESHSGYKGYGLAAMVEIFSSLFAGGAFGHALSGIDENGNKIPHQLGHFFIAIDISHFIDVDIFKKMAGDLVRSLRAAKRLPDESRIYTAGEKEFENEQRVPHDGVPLNDAMQKTLRKLVQDLELDIELPFA
ncbi:Ldh family oxidoreductase [candidate division KSB1 bacterium]|nr:Ldh family oxidoreductase [candidate division KSB1 bacterium]